MTDTVRSLAQEGCEACRPGSPRVSEADTAELLTVLSSWEVVVEGGIDQLAATFEFPSFRAALEFANRVGALADQADHHPQIVVEWGRATVRWWTHTINGLHRNDFIMAARTTDVADALAR